jgi:hypothetical protein
MLIAAIRADLSLPEEFFVPDLWHTSNNLPAAECELMLDVWHLGSDLAKALGYKRSEPEDFIRNNVGGTVFIKPKDSET